MEPMAILVSNAAFVKQKMRFFSEFVRILILALTDAMMRESF